MQPNGNVIVDTICRTAKLGTTITGATENGDVTVIEAEPVEPINECPTCGQPGVFRDHVIRSLVDLPIVGHPTTSCAPSTLPVHQQALLAEDLPCWPCLRARQFKDHGPGDPLDPATTLPKSDERCRCTQVIRPGVGYEVSQVLFRLMKPVFETTYGAQRTPMPKLPQHRLPHQTHDSGIHTLNPHACNLLAFAARTKEPPTLRHLQSRRLFPLVRPVRLELTRQRHWNLNPARLPIPPRAHKAPFILHTAQVGTN